MAGSRTFLPTIKANGKSFSRTESLVQRGWSASRVLRHYIDGKPASKDAWTAALAEAKDAERDRVAA